MTLLLNANGEVTNTQGKVLYNAGEQPVILKNAGGAGYETDITTLTGIRAKITQQKFAEFAPADYMPVVVGENAFMGQIAVFREFLVGDDFESGVVNTMSNNSKLASADASIDSLGVKITSWGKGLNYSIFELQQAAKVGNWSLVEAKEKSLYKNWQLGIQKIAFVGSATDANTTGLLTNASVSSNTTLITKPISSMSETEFQAFVAALLGDYVRNANYTVMPDTLLISTDDFLGTPKAASASFPINSQIEYLTKAFQQATGNPNFEVKHVPYCAKAQNTLNKNRYALYRNDAETMRMDIPVDFTTTIPGTLNGINWESGAFGQYTGLYIPRPAEVRYYDFT